MFKEAKRPPLYPPGTFPGAIAPDSQPAARSFALKIMDVEGKRFLAEEAVALPQNFLMVSNTIILAGDVKTYHDMQLRIEKLAHGLEILQTAIQEVGVLADKAFEV